MIETYEDVLNYSTGYEFDRKGKPITMMKQATLMSDEDYKRVASTEIDERAWVSTVWIGTDPGFNGETIMRIRDPESWQQRQQERDPLQKLIFELISEQPVKPEWMR